MNDTIFKFIVTGYKSIENIFWFFGEIVIILFALITLSIFFTFGIITTFFLKLFGIKVS
tara:strand:+ start:291 stop:467 length:177 start_codon:yes stop_codon:yes gene_type:complete